jgi:lysozyme
MSASSRAAVAGGGVAATIALALPLVAAWEGLKLTPYKDLIGKPTVCFGETNVEMKPYTRPECEAMLQRSLAKYAGPVIDCLPPAAPLSVKAAITSLAYNTGPVNACSSSAAQAARAGDYPAACDKLLLWDKARINGKLVAVKGLTNRRKAERELCLKGLS